MPPLNIYFGVSSLAECLVKFDEKTPFDLIFPPAYLCTGKVSLWLD